VILASSTGIAGRLANALYSELFSGPELEATVSAHLLQKAYHVLLFGVLGWLVVSGAAVRSRRLLVQVAAWSFVVGAVSEALQLAFADRGPSLWDVLLNGVSGCLAGWLALRLSSTHPVEPGALHREES
jgi:VanZ family protein